MNIVIEGMDGSGKSTLARFISSRTGLGVMESEGPPRYVGDIADRIAARNRLDRMIFVRHPVVSHPIYEAARRMSGKATREIVAPHSEQAFYHSRPLLIFCRSPFHHIPKDHDNSDHLRMIQSQQVLISALYSRWAIRHTNLMYDIGDDMGRIVSYIQNFDPVRDVRLFHEKHGIDYAGKPRVPDFELAQFRLKFLREETAEYEEHLDAALFELDKLTRSPSFAKGEFAFDNTVLVDQLAQSLDALVDLVYVALGTAHLQGLPFYEAWRRVHDANMAKVMATAHANAESRVKLKLTKPVGWQAPDHRDLVQDHAHSTESRS